MPQRYQSMGRYRGKTLITRYQAARESHDVTSAQLSIVVWKMSAPSEKRFVGVLETETDYFVENMTKSVWEVNFVLFNSMLKGVINRLMHAFFHIRTVIIPRPISTLGLNSPWPISLLIWKRAYGMH